MFLNYLDFLNFLYYLKNYECDQYPYVEDVTNVSNDKYGHSLVESDELMFNFENIRNNVFSNQKIIPSTVDGLYFNFDGHLILSLYFVEFKGGELNNQSFKYYIGEKIIPLVDKQEYWDNEPSILHDLNKGMLKEILNSYSNVVSNNLKLKPFESLFIIFPKICEEYAIENNIDFSIGQYYSFLLTQIKCHLIVVYESGRNHLNDEKTFAADIKDKYKVLKNNGIITDFKVYDELDFKNNLLKDMTLFPISFLDIIISVVENTLNESQNPWDFGGLVVNNLDEELNAANIRITENQKEKLRKVCSKCCMDYIT